jgi:RimJ/RimL family protein N-acetyltransferase
MHSHVIETERLYLRNFQDTDFAAVHEYGSLPDFSQYELWGPNTEPHSRAFITESIAKALHIPRYQYQMAIILKTTDELIGGANIELESENSRVAHIGYAVNPRFQNNGYATEISKALIKFGFVELNLAVIYATCDTRNAASYTVLEKCGMRRVGKIIGNRKIRGSIYDTYRYEIYPDS